MDARTHNKGIRIAQAGAVAVSCAAALTLLRYTVGYPLFHATVEMFAISVAVAIFLVIWSTRHHLESGYLYFLGTSLLFVGIIDLVHTVAFEGTGLFDGRDGTDTAAQLWLLARFLQAGALLAAPLFARRRPDIRLLAGSMALVTASGLAAVLWWDAFPATYVEGEGLTGFKVASEWAVVLMLLGALAGLRAVRDAFEADVLRLVAWSIALSIASELAFMLYVDADGPLNLAGHLMKVGAFFLLYKALVETSLRRPMDVLFREVKASEQTARALYEEQRDVADVIQSGMLSMPASLPGVELAHEYRSCSDLARIGGDFYDAFVAPGGRVCFMLGDVSGKGVEAARLSQLSRNTLHAFATEDQAPQDVLRRANDALEQQLADDRFVTAVFGCLEPATGRLTLAAAGHPPPVVCSLSSCYEHIPSVGPPLGAFAGATYGTSELTLLPADTVVVYSDGLLDARRHGEPFGEERIREVMEAASPDGPRAIVRALMAAVEAHSGGRASDDIAVFAIRWPGPGGRRGTE